MFRNHPFGGSGVTSLTNTVVSPGVAGCPSKAMGERVLMGRNAGSRRVSDTGSTTGVATTILALISAGTVATITLVSVHQLAPTVSHLRSADEPSVRAPRGVDVTPRSSASPSSVGGSHGNPSNQRASSPPNVTVVQVAARPRGVTQVGTPVGQVHPPALTPPSVDPTSPVPPVPTLNPSPTVRVPTGHAHPSREPRARHEHGRRAGEPTRDDRSARSRRGSSGCSQPGHHGANHHGGHGDDRGHGAQGHEGSRNDHGQHGHGHSGDGGSQHDRHGH